MSEKNHTTHNHELNFTRLHKLIEQIHTYPDTEKLIEQIPLIFCQYAGVNRCVYYAVQERKLRLLSAYCTHNTHWRKEIAQHQLEQVNIDGHSPEAQVVRTGKSVVTNHTRKELTSSMEQWIFRDVTAYISLPILSRNKVVGLILCLYTDPEKMIETHEQEYLNLAALTVGCALNTTQVIQRMNQKENELAALHKFSQLLSSGKGFSEILPVIARETAKSLQTKICIIRYLEGDEMVLGAVVGMEPAELSERFPAHVGLSGWMVKEKKILVVKDLTTDPRVENRVLIFSRKQGLRSFIGAPLYFRNKLVGLIAIYTTTPRYFTNEEKELLSHFATEAAIAIELTKEK
ncbi:MAG: GAF domain-containing protein [bacterium]|nr:GAF domain-containing protein [bacterium]